MDIVLKIEDLVLRRIAIVLIFIFQIVLLTVMSLWFILFDVCVLSKNMWLDRAWPAMKEIWSETAVYWKK